jgi:hypothetical protein
MCPARLGEGALAEVRRRRVEGTDERIDGDKEDDHRQQSAADENERVQPAGAQTGGLRRSGRAGLQRTRNRAGRVLQGDAHA